MSKKIILTAQDLSKSKLTHNGHKKVLNQVSFKLKENTILSVIGEKNSGKSTLTKVLSRMHDDFTGVVKLEDMIISGKKIDKNTSRRFHQLVQLIPHNPVDSLNPALSIYNNLAIQLKSNDMIENLLKEIQADYNFIIETFGLEFEVKILQMKIKFYESANKLVNQRLMSLDYNLLQHKVDKYENANDALNHLIHDYESTIFDAYQQINDKLIETKEKMWEYFLERKNDYKNSVFSDEEEEFHDAMEAYAEILRQTKHSKEYIAAEEKIIALQKLKKKNNDNVKRNLISNRHLTKSLISDINLEISRFKVMFLSSTTNEKHNTFWVNYNVYKTFKRIISKTSVKTLSYLTPWQISTIKNALNDVVLYVIAELINSNMPFEEESITNHRLYMEQSLDTIEHEVANLVISYAKKSISEKKMIQKRSDRINKEIEKYQSILDAENDQVNHITEEELENAKKEYDKSAKAFNYYNIIRSEKFKQIIKTFKEREHASRANFETIFESSIAKYQDFFIKNSQYVLANLKEKIIDYKAYSYKAFKMGVVDFKNNPQLFENRLIYEKIVEQIENGNFSQKQRLMTLKYHSTVYSQAKKNFDSTLKTQNNYAKDFLVKMKGVETMVTLLEGGDIKKMMKELERLVEKLLIYQALNDVGLSREYADRITSTLTQFELQKISIARALVTNPKVLIADDPFSSVDILSQGNIVSLLKDITKKRSLSLLFTTNNIAHANLIADEVIILNTGKVIEIGLMSDIMNNQVHPYTRQLFSSLISLEKEESKMSKEDYFFLSMPSYSFGMGKTPIYYSIKNGHAVYGKKENISKWLEQNNLSFNDSNIIGEHLFDQEKIDFEDEVSEAVEEGDDILEIFERYFEYSLPYHQDVIANLNLNRGKSISDEFVAYYHKTLENKNEVTIQELKKGLSTISQYRKTKNNDLKIILKWLRSNGVVNIKDYPIVIVEERNIYFEELDKLKKENIENLKSNIV